MQSITIHFVTMAQQKGLFIPWTIKSSQGFVKYVIGCCTRLGTTSVYTNVRVTMEFEVPERHIVRPTLAIHVVQRRFATGEAKEVLL